MKTPIKDTILEGCEVLCLTGDLIACPLTLTDQEKCKERNQYEAGRQEVIKEIEAMDKRHTMRFILQALKGGE